MNQPSGYVNLSSSVPSKERNSTEIEYVKLCYTDVVARIAEQKIHLMQIVRWAAGINVVAIGVFYSSIAAGMSKYFALIPILVGIVGLLNYVAVQRDLNHHRLTLLSLREFMGGFVDDLHAGGKDAYLGGTWLKDIRNVQVAVIIVSSLLAAVFVILK